MMAKLTYLLNPQLLLDPARFNTIHKSLPVPIQAVFAQLVEALRQALAASLSNVFLTGAIILAVALVLTFFLKELSLRTTVRKADSTSSEKHSELSAKAALDATNS